MRLDIQSPDARDGGRSIPAATALPHPLGAAFVGRQSELALLGERIREAWAGGIGVGVIAGEAGIGKTSLARAAAAEAQRAGGRLLWGRGYEGGWSPPFHPWIEALGALAGAVAPDRIETILRADDPAGVSVSTLAKLVPALLRGREFGPSASVTPDEERFRLFDGIARLLVALTGDQPLLIVLDDLQWADRGSLDLLRHVVHVAAAAPLFVLGTYRDGEVDAGHPLGELLPALRRGARFTAIHLSGLEIHDVAELIAREGGEGDPGTLAERIWAETDGNPFFVGELVAYWRDIRGRARDAVPEGVRQVVARRIARLSPAAQRLLTQAAVFSSGFDFAVLPFLTELPEDDLLAAIDELLAARLIEPVAGAAERYDFVHAIVRRSLTDAVSPSRRVRLARKAAEAMERAYAGRMAPHAAEIATQYRDSASLPGAEAGVPHALAAAETARRGYDRRQVVDFLRIARDLGADLGAADRAAILTDLAIAEADAVLIEEARATADEALRALREAGAPDREVVRFYADLVTALKQNASADSRDWRPLLERGLALAAADRGRDRARLMLLVDAVEPVSREGIRAGRWRGFDPEAVAIARASGDEVAAARAVESFDARTRAETEAYLETVRTWQQPAAVMYGLTVAANDLQYRHGAFRDAESLWRELIALAERHGAINWQAQAVNQLAAIQIAAGRFDEARESEARANALFDRLGPGRRSHALSMEMATAFAMELGGDWPALAAFWSGIVDDPTLGPHDPGTLAGTLYAALAAYCHAEAGERDAARAMLERLTPILRQYAPADANHNGAVAIAGETVWRLGLGELAPAYHRLALDLQAAGVGDYPQTSVALTVARMATLMDRAAEAEAAFALARRTLEASGQRPLRAVVDLDEATALLHAGATADGGRIVALLEEATAAFDALGMAPWAARARETRSAADRRLGGRAHLPGGLTEREADVLRLVARGYSDRQISDELFISPRTVNAHLRNMFNKTGTANRTELSVWAVEHGLAGRESPTR